jgi:pentatricopeptide repeat protein
MQKKGIQPNGMTFSALIDACGRCKRSDLALQGLRLMLQQKTAEQRKLYQVQTFHNKTTTFTLANEVGAWTAAINACGRSGRLKTALRIFYAMPNFGVTPNTVTCGSIMDSLLRAGWIGETLELLRYMKSNGIRPSEVMYTSLMSRAEMLVQSERRRLHERDQRHYLSFSQNGKKYNSTFHENIETKEDTKAIEVYTELIKSLIDTNGPESTKRAGFNKQVHRLEPTDSKSLLLLKVFLVFQEMKTAGAEPDLPCYNALLHACAKAGDLKRAQSVLRQMHSNNLEPNDTSWRLLLRAAMMSTAEVFESEERVRVVDLVWKQAVSYRRKSRLVDEPHVQQWHPSARSFTMLTSFYLKEAATVGRDESLSYYRLVIRLYEDILLCRNEEMGMNRIDLNLLLENEKAMITILQAAVALDMLLDPESEESKHLRNMASSITKLECFQTLEYKTLSWPAKNALKKSQLWAV